MSSDYMSSFTDSHPTMRLATFCKMVLLDHQAKGLSLIGVMDSINLHIEGRVDTPSVIDFFMQDFCLYASFNAPQKRLSDVTITTELKSSDLPALKMEPTDSLVKFTEGKETGNLTVRMDGMRIPIPVKDGTYTIDAKWSVGPKVLGRLSLPIRVEVVKPE